MDIIFEEILSLLKNGRVIGVSDYKVKTCQVNPDTAGFIYTINFLCIFYEFSLAAIANIWGRVIHCIDQRIITRLSF